MINNIFRSALSLLITVLIIGAMFVVMILSALITMLCQIPFAIVFFGLSTAIVLTVKFVHDSIKGEKITLDFSDDKDLNDQIK